VLAPRRAPAPALRRARPKIGRNDPCWCGSGQKYKKCHMDADAKAGVPMDDDGDDAPEAHA
jgi:hypothetical protein